MLSSLKSCSKPHNPLTSLAYAGLFLFTYVFLSSTATTLPFKIPNYLQSAIETTELRTWLENSPDACAYERGELISCWELIIHHSSSWLLLLQPCRHGKKKWPWLAWRILSKFFNRTSRIFRMPGIIHLVHQILQTNASFFETVRVHRSLPKCSYGQKWLWNMKQMISRFLSKEFLFSR